MATKRRRMGPQDSESSNALLDATEQVMVKEGYAAVTSRRVAEEAGLKQQLVYYYFETMDELLLAAFQRRTRRGLERLAENLRSRQPLHAVWDDYTKSVNATLTFEYMALANHNKAISAEVTDYLAKARKMQLTVIKRKLAKRPELSGLLTPEAMSFLLSNLAIVLRREEAQGIAVGHDDVRRLVEHVLSICDS